MKKYIIIAIIILALSFAFSGCEDILIRDDNKYIKINHRRIGYDKRGYDFIRLGGKIS